MAGKVQIPSSSGTGLGGGASKLGGGVMKRLNPKSESVALARRLKQRVRGRGRVLRRN